MATKVQGTSATAKNTKPVATETKTEKAPKEIVLFDLSTATDSEGAQISLENGKLTASPANFPHGKAKPLGKEDFANSATLFDFQVSALKFRISKMNDKLESLTTKAKNARRFKTDKAAKRANRIDKLAKMIAELKAEEEAEAKAAAVAATA